MTDAIVKGFQKERFPNLQHIVLMSVILDA
jgi:hypothetical protein